MSWRLVQRGHAVANAMPVMPASRIGLETAVAQGAGATGDATTGGEVGVRFYGSSFIAGQIGALLAEASRARQEVITATVDLDAARRHREDWTFVRDRRPSCAGRRSRPAAGPDAEARLPAHPGGRGFFAVASRAYRRRGRRKLMTILSCEACEWAGEARARRGERSAG